jgi:hypothetical protein
LVVYLGKDGLTHHIVVSTRGPLLFSLFKAIARMHGTFYRDTTPIHVALMAKAHKVCNHPRNITKDKTLLGIEWHDGQLNHFHVKWDTESDAPHKICCSAIGSPKE